MQHKHRSLNLNKFLLSKILHKRCDCVNIDFFTDFSFFTSTFSQTRVFKKSFIVLYVKSASPQIFLLFLMPFESFIEY